MNKNISHFRRPHLAPASLLTALLFSSGIAQAQSQITLYGRLDLAMRHISNATKAGSSLNELMPGATSSSRWGVRGSEDLGNGLKAHFQLEGGINPDVGSSTQSGRVFGRTSTLGLEGGFGSLIVGRQISLAYEVEGYNEPFGWANVFEPAFIYDNYTSKRWDNSLRYNARSGALSGSFMFSLGELAGNGSAGRNAGASLNYASGPLSVNSVYQRTHNNSGVIEHELYSIGGSYAVAPFKFNFSFLKHQSDTHIQTNDVWASGLTYAATPAVDLIAGGYYDRQKKMDGNKKMLSVMCNYKLSNRSNVYVQADQGSIAGAYRTNVFDDQGYRYAPGIEKRSSLSLGIRHQF